MPMPFHFPPPKPMADLLESFGTFKPTYPLLVEMDSGMELIDHLQQADQLINDGGVLLESGGGLGLMMGYSSGESFLAEEHKLQPAPSYLDGFSCFSIIPSDCGQQSALTTPSATAKSRGGRKQGSRKRKSGGLPPGARNSCNYSSAPVSGDDDGGGDEVEPAPAKKNGTGRSGTRGKKQHNARREDEKPKEVVHVRARRGQATDSHSLAERVRREKINERMRCLQDLVPGCYKAMGMAVMLDEIINYVQSLQNQVEFLSMKLSAASSLCNFDLDVDAIETAPQVADGGYEGQVLERLMMMREGYGHGIGRSPTFFHSPSPF